MHHSIIAILMLTLCSCAWNNQPSEHESTLIPDRKEAVGFFSSVHETARDTERGIYGLMYGLRDGIDTFIYDAQKDYYQDYQK